MSTRSEVEQAFIDVVDGQGIQDLVCHTGLSEQRCEEILHTFSKVLDKPSVDIEVVLGQMVNRLSASIEELQLRIAKADLALMMNLHVSEVRAILKGES